MTFAYDSTGYLLYEVEAAAGRSNRGDIQPAKWVLLPTIASLLPPGYCIKKYIPALSFHFSHNSLEFLFTFLPLTSSSAQRYILVR
jgi:hypothetical protein